MELISTDGLYSIGTRDTLYSLSNGSVDTLIVWEDLPSIRYEIKNKITNEKKVVCIDPPTNNNNNNNNNNNKRFLPKELESKEWELIDNKPLIDWLTENYLNFGSKN